MRIWEPVRFFRSSSVSPGLLTSTMPLMPAEPGDANCNPYSAKRVRFTSSSSTSISTSGRALSIMLMRRPAASMRSGVSVIVIAFVPCMTPILRASMTMRSRSIVSLRSALLR